MNIEWISKFYKLHQPWPSKISFRAMGTTMMQYIYHDMINSDNKQIIEVFKK